MEKLKSEEKWTGTLEQKTRKSWFVDQIGQEFVWSSIDPAFEPIFWGSGVADGPAQDVFMEAQSRGPGDRRRVAELQRDGKSGKSHGVDVGIFFQVC